MTVPKEVKYLVRYGLGNEKDPESWWAEMLVPTPEMPNKQMERILVILKAHRLVSKICKAQVMSVQLEPNR